MMGEKRPIFPLSLWRKRRRRHMPKEKREDEEGGGEVATFFVKKGGRRKTPSWERDKSVEVEMLKVGYIKALWKNDLTAITELLFGEMSLSLCFYPFWCGRAQVLREELLTFFVAEREKGVQARNSLNSAHFWHFPDPNFVGFFKKSLHQPSLLWRTRNVRTVRRGIFFFAKPQEGKWKFKKIEQLESWMYCASSFTKL